MSQFQQDDNNNEAKAIAIPLVFSKNNRAKNSEKKLVILDIKGR